MYFGVWQSNHFTTDIVEAESEEQALRKYSEYLETQGCVILDLTEKHILVSMGITARYTVKKLSKR